MYWTLGSKIRSSENNLLAAHRAATTGASPISMPTFRTLRIRHPAYTCVSDARAECIYTAWSSMSSTQLSFRWLGMPKVPALSASAPFYKKGPSRTMCSQFILRIQYCGSTADSVAQDHTLFSQRRGRPAHEVLGNDLVTVPRGRCIVRYSDRPFHGSLELWWSHNEVHVHAPLMLNTKAYVDGLGN